MITYKNLPLYQVMFPEGEEDGIMRVSLVDDPAVQSLWDAFAEVKEPMKFSIENEDEHTVTGCFLRADYPILRKRGEQYFYLTFSKDVIRTMVTKWMAENRQNDINTDHQEDTKVNDIYVQEVFIKNVEKGINPVGFEDVEDGSAFASYKILDDDVWSKVKDGTWNGFSIEMVASICPVDEINFQSIENEDEVLMDEIVEILNKIIENRK